MTLLCLRTWKAKEKIKVTSKRKCFCKNGHFDLVMVWATTLGPAEKSLVGCQPWSWKQLWESGNSLRFAFLFTIGDFCLGTPHRGFGSGECRPFHKNSVHHRVLPISRHTTVSKLYSHTLSGRRKRKRVICHLLCCLFLRKKQRFTS